MIRHYKLFPHETDQGYVIQYVDLPEDNGTFIYTGHKVQSLPERYSTLKEACDATVVLMDKLINSSTKESK